MSSLSGNINSNLGHQSKQPLDICVDDVIDRQALSEKSDLVAQYVIEGNRCCQQDCPVEAA